MKKATFMIIAFLAFTLAANAQSYIEHIQVHEEGKGDVTIDLPQSLSDLINGFAKAPKTDAKSSANGEEDLSGDARGEKGTGGSGDAGVSKRKENSSNHVYKKGENVSVYSITVYSGGNSRESHEKAVSIARQANAKFPGCGARATFNSPRWIVIMGAYATQEAAQAMVKRMHSAGFSQASISRRNVVKK